MPRTGAARQAFADEMMALGAKHAITRGIRDVLYHSSFPVDVRHNAKIQRGKLAVWAAGKLK